MRKHPTYINKFLFNVIEQCLPAKKKKSEVCVFTSRDYVQVCMRMFELKGVFIIREKHWQDGSVNYNLMKIE